MTVLLMDSNLPWRRSVFDRCSRLIGWRLRLPLLALNHGGGEKRASDSVVTTGHGEVSGLGRMLELLVFFFNRVAI